MAFNHFLFASTEDIYFRFVHLQFHVAEHLGDPFAQAVQHILEQIEGLALVFVQGVALCIGPEPNTLAQVIQGQEVLFPQLVQKL